MTPIDEMQPACIKFKRIVFFLQHHMAYLDLLQRRYATKKFNGKMISDEQLKLLKEAIRLSPSSFNSQPWKVKVVSDQKTKELLKPLTWNQEQVTTCSHLFIFCVPKDVPKRFEELYALMRKSGAPEQSVKGFASYVQGSLDKLTPEQQVAWMQRQVYLAMMSLMAEAAELGLDSCPMEGFDSEGYAKALNLKGLIPVTLCPVGFAADTPRTKVRFAAKDIFF